MKKLATMLTPVIMLSLILGSIACSSGGEGAQPTAAPTQAATGGDIGKTVQSSSLKVTLDNLEGDWFGYGGFAALDMTLENIGASKLQQIKAYVPNTNFSLNIYRDKKELLPEERYKVTRLIMLSSLVGEKYSSINIPLRVYAEDQTGKSYIVSLDLPSFKSMPKPSLPAGIQAIRNNQVNWQGNKHSVQADNFYVVAGNTLYTGNPGGYSVNVEYGAIKVSWYEHGNEAYFCIYFDNDGTSWWSDNIRFYPDIRGEWVGVEAGDYFKTRMGEVFTGDTNITGFNGYIYWIIHFENLRIRAFLGN